jgi:dihydrodipicolinate synthase/N-acetylneuraminate lyase
MVQVQSTNKSLTQAERMSIFQALVEAQDGKAPVPESRRAMAQRFGVSDEQVRHIEEEGLLGLWAPLNE